ncbi:MAG: DUF6603 domain-containing protein [Caldimonas sp.]
MAKPDKVFKQTYAWYNAAIQHVVASLPAAQRDPIGSLIWQALGLSAPGPAPADPDLSAFRNTGADAASLARAAEAVAEALVALGFIQQAVAALKPPGNPASALALIGPVMRQIDQLGAAQAGSRYPSAFSIGKMLLMLSGDADAAPAAGHEADRLATLLGASAAQMADAQAAIGMVSLLVGSMIDRSFKAPSPTPSNDWLPQGLPAFAAPVALAFSGPAGIGGNLQVEVGPPSALKAGLNLAFNPAGQAKSITGTDFTLSLAASAGVQVYVPIAPPGKTKVSGAYEIGIALKRSSAAGALVIGSDALGVKLSIGELGIGLKLNKDGPALQFFARDAKAVIKPGDGFLKMLLGDGITLGFDVVAEADRVGRLRLVNGTGLHASLPVPTLPTGPFKLQLVNLGLEPVGGKFAHLQVELSASFGVELGPFQASVDRLGLLLDLDIENAAHPLAFDFKPPNGIGLSLDAGIVKGGGYLAVDANGYAGVLELKMLAVDVKAIALLNTHSEAGFSLLLLIFGQFPPIQLSFGFTLTGVGGLIGVQHTASPSALSQGIGNGSLDAVLFPANPVADAPQIIATLRTLFPVKAGGFVIGPMLELGWGTPSLVTVRLGLLIEAGQFVLLGQAIVQVPPLVSADLALLYLRLDFVGSVVFDPLHIAFDAKLVHSRVAFITITGQFAFRAQFGDQPTFLISAGGFHPAFREIPSDIPMPFDRVGASFDIGVVGVSFKGYFAITSATIQAGSDLRMWADFGIASIEGGYGFDAICYLVPKFYFEIDLHAYLAIHVFGFDFASVHLDGHLAGPGRWHIAGTASVHTPWPLPDFSLHVDEAWGSDRDTPQITVNVADLLAKEIAKTGNWSAQLPRGGDSYLSLADIDDTDSKTDVLAHPLGTLVFQQKLVPFELRMAKASGSAIEGPNEFAEGALKLSQDGAPSVDVPSASKRTDFFAAAQFLDLSQSDRLAKPSFESFTAGYELGNDDYEIGEVIGEVLNYEEADLGAERFVKKSRRIGRALYADAVHGPMLNFGSAGRSSLRDRALSQPANPSPLRVDPAPVVVATKSTLAVTGARAYSSVWQADQARGATAGVALARLQVVELAEMTA